MYLKINKDILTIQLDGPVGGDQILVFVFQEQPIVCDQFGNENYDLFGASNGGFTVTLDPQVGWEQQKSLIA